VDVAHDVLGDRAEQEAAHSAVGRGADRDQLVVAGIGELGDRR
jgi:hypothetical protein